jgi:hypothetical protein
LKVGILLPVLKPISDDTKSKSLRLSFGLSLRGAIGEDAWKFANFGQPPTIVFPLDFDDEFHLFTS